ncbi:hypothetical protein V3C99_013886 [Haemonchus contortus]|uniref:PHM7_cyt domain-containing protein n=1 Tax=Haemonchus contortus TaxID=6289 RepID=A0A7I4YRW9_HAECO
MEVTEKYFGESEDPPDVTTPQEIEECPFLPYDGISSSTPPPGVLFFNVLGQKLMSKIVGDVLGARSEEEPAEALSNNPFGNVTFWLLLTIGNLLALAVPITILFIYLFSSKRSQYGSREQVLLLSLDTFHLVAALVLGICTVMLIWNNDNLASIGLQDHSLQERMEEHTRKFMCLVNKSFASAVSSHLPDSNSSRTILKQALMNTLIQKSDYKAYTRNVERKDKLLGLLARTKLGSANPDPDKLQEAEENITLTMSLELEDIFGDPVYIEGQSTKWRVDAVDKYKKAVAQMAYNLSNWLGKQQNLAANHTYRNAVVPQTFSSSAVLIAILIVCLCFSIILILVVRTFDLRDSISSKSSVSQDSLLKSIVLIRIPLVLAVLVALLGALMALLYTWGIYNGYRTMYLEKIMPEHPLPRGNLSFIASPGYHIDVNTFLRRCKDKHNFINAFDTGLLLNNFFMRSYADIDLDREDDDDLSDEILYLNIEKFNNGTDKVQEQVDEIAEAFLKAMGKDAPIFTKVVDDIRAIPAQMRITNETKTFEIYRYEVERRRQKNIITLNMLVKQALDEVKNKNHKCDDMPLLWTQWHTRFYHDINRYLQGQWLICALIGLFSLLIFAAKIQQYRILDAMEGLQSSPREEKPSTSATVDPSRNYDPKNAENQPKVQDDVPSNMASIQAPPNNPQMNWAHPGAKSMVGPLTDIEGEWIPKNDGSRGLKSYMNDLLKSMQDPLSQQNEPNEKGNKEKKEKEGKDKKDTPEGVSF